MYYLFTIILLFNVGGLEKDLGFDKLIVLNNVSKIIYSSSASVYGLKKEKNVTENLS